MKIAPQPNIFAHISNLAVGGLWKTCPAKINGAKNKFGAWGTCAIWSNQAQPDPAKPSQARPGPQSLTEVHFFAVTKADDA